APAEELRGRGALDGGAAPAGALEQRDAPADARHELDEGVRIDGLHEEVVGAGPERLDGALERPDGREHDDAARAPVLADRPQELAAREAREHPVEERHVERLLAAALEALLRGRR